MSLETQPPAGAGWGGVLVEERKLHVEAVLPEYLLERRWFSAKARTIRQVRITGAVPFGAGAGAPEAAIAFLEVEYAEGDRQTFVLPLAHAAGEAAARLAETAPGAVVARLDDGSILYDAVWNAAFPQALLAAIAANQHLGAGAAAIRASRTPVFAALAGEGDSERPVRVSGAEQSNTSIIYGSEFILKLFRRLEQGTSPDLEIGAFLTAAGFPHIPPLAGALELTGAPGEPRTLAILQGFIPNRGDAWDYTLGELAAYYGRAAAQAEPPAPPRPGHLLEVAADPVPEPLRTVLGPYLDVARLLGRRTGELHVALAAGAADPAFAPEPLTADYQRTLYESVHELTGTAFALLRGRLDSLPAATRTEADAVLAQEGTLLAAAHPLLEHTLVAQRTRVHGDYHLGQVLYTGSDFVIIDFEGEPLRSLAERRRKQTPLKDVAGMIRSFHYAAYAALFGQTAAPANGDAWAAAWYHWTSTAFLTEYLAVAGAGSFLPTAPADLRLLLDAYLLEKAIYELIYELNNRPNWVRIPLQGIRALVE